MEKLPCLPVKITDKQWADKLQDGSVFMRSLYEYGSWSSIERSQAGDNITSEKQSRKKMQKVVK